MTLGKTLRQLRQRLRFRVLGAGLLGLVFLAPVSASTSPIPGNLTDAELRGSATFRFVGLAIYDAQLYTPDGAPFNWSQDFALKLTYRKALKQKALVGSTLDEMERQGNAAPVKAQLQQCFQAVGKGDSYIAVSQGLDRIAFWRNGRKTCTLSYPGIKRAFMGIFLGQNTRSASFTQQLMGQ